MSFYDALENARLRDKNAAMIRELDALRVELAEVRARAERLGSMLDLANSAMAAVNEVARKVIAERDAAIGEARAAEALAADSDARLVRAIDAAKAAALAALAAPSPAGRLDALETILDFDCDGVRHYVADDSEFLGACDCRDDGLDCGDGLDAARKGRTTPSVRR